MAFGKGDAEWIATLLDADTIRAVLREAVEHAGIADAGTALAGQVDGAPAERTPAASR